MVFQGLDLWFHVPTAASTNESTNQICYPSQSLPGNKGKHWVGGGPTKNLSPASDKHSLTLLPTPKLSTQSLSSCCQFQSCCQDCQETKENIGLVVVLPFPCQWQTLSHTAANSKAVDPEPLILSPVLPGTKQTDGGGLSGGPTKNQTLKLSALLLFASGKQSLTLLLSCTIIAALCFFWALTPQLPSCCRCLGMYNPSTLARGLPSNKAQDPSHKVFWYLPGSANPNQLAECVSMHLSSDPPAWGAKATATCSDCQDLRSLHLLQPAKLTLNNMTPWFSHVLPCLDLPTLLQWGECHTSPVSTFTQIRRSWTGKAKMPLKQICLFPCLIKIPPIKVHFPPPVAVWITKEVSLRWLFHKKDHPLRFFILSQKEAAAQRGCKKHLHFCCQAMLASKNPNLMPFQ